ncbi:divalent-cation tolerance protein CutA [Parerythrobacter lacustris]|uniref:Divalent-cation tolerance protein CutA n=1 Tax=Parerythrobacter lacustris TaxID=2969984 RepID=A0ABT1XS70_9SPHN|nr:divalent-cation tolerance protein CutA [Parerythrobacter lacustris]MCR2834498.1 divalent-cation tolerance protein CutA [Parerythrobacter lacustris]
MSALIWSPFADPDQARAVAKALLEEKLIACANIVPCVVSIFEWQGEISEAAEVGVLFKTHADLLDDAVARIEQLHPYESPAIIGWQGKSVGVATGEWLARLSGGA